MPYDILHSERKDWLAAKQEVIGGIQSDSRVALEATREAYRKAVERQSETLVAAILEELEASVSARRPRSRSSPTTASRGVSASRTRTAVKGVYHMHGATLFDEIVQVPLILSAPGTARLGRRLLAGAVGRPHARRWSISPGFLPGERDGESLLPLVRATRRAIARR